MLKLQYFSSRLFSIALVFNLSFAAIFAQEEKQNIITQPFDPHPVFEMLRWQISYGQKTVESIFSLTNSGWQEETLNNAWQGEQTVKWFRRQVEVPRHFAGKDVILIMRTDGAGTVFMDGKKLFNAGRLHGRHVLLAPAKGGEKFTLALRMGKRGYDSRFFQAELHAMPAGYGDFITTAAKIRNLQPGAGIEIKKFRYKMAAPDSAAQKDYPDSHWPETMTGKSWPGEFQHAWYRTQFTLPDKIGAFSVAGKRIRLFTSINDKGELWIDGEKMGAVEDDASFLLPKYSAANPTIQLAVKVVNVHGTGDLRYVRLLTEEEFSLRHKYKELAGEIDRIDRYFLRHPQPEPQWLQMATNGLNAIFAADSELDGKLFRSSSSSIH